MVVRLLLAFGMGVVVGGWGVGRYLSRVETPEKPVAGAAERPAPPKPAAPRIAASPPKARPPMPRTPPPPAPDPPEPVRADASERECPFNAMAARDESMILCRCSESATESGTVWGTGTYTGDSSICRAAKHAGYWRADGDEVRVYLREGQEQYEKSESYGVLSEAFGAFETSFTFR